MEFQYTPALLQACGVCVTSLAERVVPKILWFGGLSLLWFVSTAAICFAFGRKPHYFPGLVLSIVFSVVAVLFGVMTIGPLMALALGGIAFGVFWGAYRKYEWIGTDHRFRKVVLEVGVTFLSGTLLLGTLSAYSLVNRSMADYIIEWSGSAGGRNALRELAENEPHSLGEYRVLLEKGSPSCSCLGFVASRVALIGSHSDVSLLVKALARIEQDPNAPWPEDHEQVSTALKTLTGMNLGPDATAKNWRDALEKSSQPGS